MREDNTARLHIELLNLETKRRDYEKQVEENKKMIEEIKDEIIEIQYEIIGGYHEEELQEEEHKIKDKDVFPKGIMLSGIEPHIYPHKYPHTYSGKKL